MSRRALTLCCALLALDAPAQTVSYHTSADGVFYREAGDPALPPMVLLHGFPSSSHMFRELMPALAGRFHVLAPDYPGMGHSAAPPEARGPATFDGLADTIERFVAQTSRGKVILYMQDFGGPVGMRLAVRHPDWIAGLIFQNTPISLDGWAPERLAAVQAGAMAAAGARRAAAAQRVTLATAQFLYRQGARHPAQLNPDAWVNDAYALSIDADRRVMTDLQVDIPNNLPLYAGWQAYLKAAQPPALVVWGDGDPLFAPAGADAVRRWLPAAEVVHYATGHFALEEEGADIARRILARFVNPPAITTDTVP
ncbi:pimeloyl-ACP methyl ester carboxylesterase [Duganella sp. 1224]|uniref:alpha/beta fold hydrolase n=1 Tax=Duganella sp. 1224 TaxID=2587052 RepID=UPI0015CB0584|nr:alpha/beta hydrolase [Duganella sp. 1224]NYE59428.1 pimeloyl-ACP methyl ester carboxylesterase [Duganella sp. 1224]